MRSAGYGFIPIAIGKIPEHRVALAEAHTMRDVSRLRDPTWIRGIVN